VTVLMTYQNLEHHFEVNSILVIITFIIHNQAQNLYLIATFRSSTANFIRHMVT